MAISKSVSIFQQMKHNSKMVSRGNGQARTQGVGSSLPTPEIPKFVCIFTCFSDTSHRTRILKDLKDPRNTFLRTCLGRRIQSHHPFTKKRNFLLFDYRPLRSFRNKRLETKLEIYLTEKTNKNKVLKAKQE